VSAPGVLANDSDLDGLTLTAVSITGPVHGTLTLNLDGSFTYVPAPQDNGPDAFTYEADNGVSRSATATVNITVLPMTDAPIAVDDVYATDEDTALSVAAPGVLANDSDMDGD